MNRLEQDFNSHLRFAISITFTSTLSVGSIAPATCIIEVQLNVD
jgi:hypothetical protein